MLNQTTAGPARCALLTTLCIAVLIRVGTAHAAAPPASACTLVSAPHGDLAMQVPFEVVDGRIYVQAKVNGRGPFRFALDTGASGLGRADTSLVSALDLRMDQPAANSDGVITTEVDTTKFGSLDIGGLMRENVQVITRDYNSKMTPQAAFAGIVAREFFSDGLLIIDYPRKTISFSRKLSLSRLHDGALPYEKPFRIPVSIAGVRTQGNLDTGANVAFVLPQSLFVKVGGTPLQQAGHGQLANSRIETKRSTVHGPFQIGRASLWDADVRVSEQYPEVIVGAHALQNFIVLIDQRSKSVAVCQ